MIRSTGGRLIARPGTFMAAPLRRRPWWTGMVAELLGGGLALTVILIVGGAR